LGRCGAPVVSNLRRNPTGKEGGEGDKAMTRNHTESWAAPAARGGSEPFLAWGSAGEKRKRAGWGRSNEPREIDAEKISGHPDASSQGEGVREERGLYATASRRYRGYEPARPGQVSDLKLQAVLKLTECQYYLGGKKQEEDQRRVKRIQAGIVRRNLI